MNNIKKIFDYIEKSNTVTIGYDSINEENTKLFLDNTLEISNYEPPFMELYRDYKISQVLDTDIDVKYVEKYLHLDINKTIIEKKNKFTLSKPGISTNLMVSQELSRLIEKIRLYCLDNKKKIIFTTPIYNSIHNNGFNLIGGTSLVYYTDLVLTISDNKININKNRFGQNFEIILK